jgi:hypothetical protein
MAKKKKINYTPYLIGAGALGILAYAFKDDLKNLFKPQNEGFDIQDPNLTPTPIIENVVTPSGVTPMITTVTAGLNPLGTPKDKLNLNQNLKFGDKGQEVAKLQQILNRIAKITGKPIIKEDGVWGDGTETRVKNMFTTGTINLYKMYVALFAIFAANEGKQGKKWFDVYQTYLNSPQLLQAGRATYFKTNSIL